MIQESLFITYCEVSGESASADVKAAEEFLETR